MKKLLGLLAVVLFIAGCTAVGTLTISNNTGYDSLWFEIDNNGTYLLGAYEYYEKDWDLSSTIFGDEEKDVDVDFGGTYVFTQTKSITVKAGSDEELNIYTDAGEIIVWNNSGLYNIMEVYIAPSSDSSWGYDDLSGIIGPGGSASWYISPGWWDIKLVDDYGDEFVSFDNYIGLEESLILYYDGFRKTDNAESEKVENTKKYSENRTIDKVQKN